MGVSDTHFSCKGEGGFMYEGLFVGNAASILSLSTNLAATILTAYKAWVCRKAFHRLMAKGSRTSQVESVLALLVESGALYCALWIVVVVWQVGIDNRFIKNSVMASLKKEPPRPSFWTVGGVLIEGCLVPLIAIYPTIIIVVVALNKSPVDNNMKGDLPGPDPLTVVVNTTVTSHSDLESPRTSGEGKLPHDVDGDHKLAYLADHDVSAMV
ncbi:hypothetical protein BD311DRAFT_696339 [Dichomitus squalens]|uniref:Uncharacterized protein n=1 Tax=Dichomitus squalens TaxID=114155 RepID=A0A4Q9MJC2_9APHY|nr:hypothetical protein BD311DRAFT_696339 [Dichomitus squalens]